MARAQHQTTIAAPTAEVFDFLVDGTNNPKWQPSVVETDRVGDDLGLGTRFRQRVRHPLGFTVGANYRITSFEPPHHLAQVVTSGGPFRPTLDFELRDTDGSTVVVATVEYRPSGVMALVRPVLALLHPLFAWEAGWIERARPLLEHQDLAS